MRLLRAYASPGQTTQITTEGGTTRALTVTLNHLLSTLLIWLNRIIAALQSGKHLHTARFALAHELTGLLSPLKDETGLLLGVGSFSQVFRVRPTKARRELGNMLVVAPTRGGKGLLAVSQLLTFPGSIVVNDIKGDLFLQTAGYRKTLGKVFVLDPTGVGHAFDPLSGKHTEDEFFSAATHLLFKPDEGDGTIFTQRATVMLTQLLLAARQEGYSPLPYVRRLIRDGLLATAAKLDTLSPELATQFLDVEFSQANFDDRFLLSAWGTLSARMRPLLTETVIRSLAASDFHPRDIMLSTTPITVYLRWPERDLLALSPLVRLLWGSIIDELVATYDTNASRNCNPVLLLIDEAGRTAIPSLADHSTTVVGRGISLWIAIQSLSQLETVYGKPRAQTILDNVDSQLFYRPSNPATADYIEHALGKKSDYAHSQTMRDGAGGSEGRTEQAVPLMTAQEIKQMPDEAVIAFHRGLKPFQLTRMDWRQFPVLTKRQGIKPPQLSRLPLHHGNLPTTIWQQTREQATYIDPDKRN